MSIWLLWLIIVAIPGIPMFFMSVTITLVFTQIICGVTITDDHPFVIVPWVTKSLFCSVSLLFLAFAFVPTKEEMTYIVGGYFVTNVEDIEKLPPNLVKSANKFLEDYTTQEPKE